MVCAAADIGVMLSWGRVLVQNMLPEPVAQVWMPCQGQIILLRHGYLNARSNVTSQIWARDETDSNNSCCNRHDFRPKRKIQPVFVLQLGEKPL